MLAGDVILGNFSRGDLAAQGSLQSVSIGASSRASTFSNDAQYNGLWSTTQTYNIAVGPGARAWGMNNTALGGLALAGLDGVSTVLHQQATAVGNLSHARHNLATALGTSATVHVENGVALGTESLLAEGQATVIGTGEIEAQPDDVVKVTYNTTTASKGGVSVGNLYQLRQMKNVADATELSDALTLRQVLDVVRQFNDAIAESAVPHASAD
jgi:hypothetical protein